MIPEALPPRDLLGEWCGWVMVGVACLTPWMAWLGPLGFAALMALAGLLCLPALRIDTRLAPLAVLLLLALAWAALSTLWTFHPAETLEESVALKLACQLVLYAAAWCGARRADPAIAARALRILAWGLGAYGCLLLVEALTGGGVYQALRSLIGDPIRPDLGRKNIAQGSFVLALIWPVAAAAGLRGGAPGWLAAPMALGAALLAQVFLSDAPTLAVGLAVGVGVLVWIWPRSAPKAMGLAAAGLVLAMPLVILIVRLAGLGTHLPVSWDQRMGYWAFAMARISDHPWRGWGLDASRGFSPAIQLHPHNGALQIWLELGVVGAVLGALIWAFVLRSLARDERSLLTAAAAASATVYLFFGLVSFGVWQEWWLALAVLVVVIKSLGDRQTAKP